MITLFKWYLMKRKEITIKLGIYTALEEGLKYIANNREEVEKKLVHEFAETVHKTNPSNNKKL